MQSFWVASPRVSVDREATAPKEEKRRRKKKENARKGQLRRHPDSSRCRRRCLCFHSEQRVGRLSGGGESWQRADGQLSKRKGTKTTGCLSGIRPAFVRRHKLFEQQTQWKSVRVAASKTRSSKPSGVFALAGMYDVVYRFPFFFFPPPPPSAPP
jgi:hypothetical protein